MPRISEKKNIIISQVLTATGTFQYPINIDFVPDEVYVKYGHYFGNGNEITVSYVYSDLVNDTLFTVFESASLQEVDTVWPLYRPIRGNFSFQLKTPAGAVDLTRNGGVLTLHLEFVKYS